MSGKKADRSSAIEARDAALGRIRRMRAWVIAGTAALTAAIAGLVSSVAPGRTLGVKKTSSAAPASTATVPTAARPSNASGSGTAPKMPPLADPQSLGLSGDTSGGASGSGSEGGDSSSSPAPSVQPQTQTESAPAPQPAPPQAAPAPAPAPAPSDGGGAVVSGGS